MTLAPQKVKIQLLRLREGWEHRQDWCYGQDGTRIQMFPVVIRVSLVRLIG